MTRLRRLSYGIPRGIALALALALVLSAGGGLCAAPALALDIEGTWFVLIHYQDPKSANPDAQRWGDRVWDFARKGSRLQWTEYPLVIFKDTRGRFEEIPGNSRSRVLAAWEPNADQAKTIAEGPRVNVRGAKTKTMRGSDAEGWASSRRMSQTSASVMGYHEQLSIRELEAMPVFERRDVVGNALTNMGEGLTRYAVSEIRDDGRTLAGTYERDGRHHGRFRAWRTAPVRSLIKQDKTPNERAADQFMQGEPPAF